MTRCVRLDDPQPATSPCDDCVARSSARQFAIATPLLIVAGLLLVTLHELARVDLGFDTTQRPHGRDPAPRREVRGAGTRRRLLERASRPRRRAAWRHRGGVHRRPAARRCGEPQQLRSRGAPGTSRRVAAGDAVGGGHARVLQAARVHARRGTAVRRARRAKRERRVGRRRSRVGETLLSEPQRARQTVSRGRLHHLSVDDGRRGRQRCEVRGPRQAERRQRLLADGRARHCAQPSGDDAISLPVGAHGSRCDVGAPERAADRCESSIPASRSRASR